MGEDKKRNVVISECRQEFDKKKMCPSGVQANKAKAARKMEKIYKKRKIEPGHHFIGEE